MSEKPNYRQAVIDAINHKPTRHTPWVFEPTRQFAEIYREKYGVADVEADLESHIIMGRYKKVKWLNDTLYEDAFGTQWQLGDDGGDIGVPINKVINADNVETYRFPDVDTELLGQTLTAFNNDTNHFRMFRLSYTAYERAWAMMGVEDILLNMALDEKLTMRLFERITEYHVGLLDHILDKEFEGIFFMDDWGSQKGLIMGPTAFRKFIKPFLKILCDKIKSKGKYVLVHSCGDIEELFPDLIELGVDVYNTVQPEIYDLRKIKDEYGKDLAFWGAMSNQQFLPNSTPEEVFEKSVETIRILGKAGGYMFSPTHAITPDIPTENIRAMRDAAKSVVWNI